jgi:hypothetical protein
MYRIAFIIVAVILFGLAAATPLPHRDRLLSAGLGFFAAAFLVEG